MLALARSVAPFWSRLETVRPRLPATERAGATRHATDPVRSVRDRLRPSRSLPWVVLVAYICEMAPVRVNLDDRACSKAAAKKSAPREKYPAVAKARVLPLPTCTLTGSAQLTRERPKVGSAREASPRISSIGATASPTACSFGSTTLTLTARDVLPSPLDS